jgi:hypothetical protein
MRSFDSERPRDDERRKLLAAMIGVYSSVKLPKEQRHPSSFGLRTMSVHDAVRTIASAEGPLRYKARRMAAARLAAGVQHERRRDHEIALANLVGGPDVDHVAGLALAKKGAAAYVYGALGARAPADDEPETSSSIDVDTMATTVRVVSFYEGRFEDLAKKIDPRSWAASPFWVAATKVIREDGRFVPDTKGPELGKSWSGLFYESVWWSMDATTYSAFQNYLDVDFEVTAPDTIALSFSLYACRGSMVLARIAPGGVEIDSGFTTVEPDGAPHRDGTRRFKVVAQKKLRFADMASRSTPNQGPDGAGQFLNYMSPAVVAVWMHDILYDSLNDGASA